MIRLVSLALLLSLVSVTHADEPAARLFIFFEGKQEPLIVAVNISGHEAAELAFLKKGFPSAEYDPASAKKTVRSHPLTKLAGVPDLEFPSKSSITAQDLIFAWRRQSEGRLLQVKTASAPLPHVDLMKAKLASLLDMDHDGKLTKAEANAAPKLLDKFDVDDDGCLIAFELVPTLLTDAEPRRASRTALDVAVIFAGYSADDAKDELKRIRPDAKPEQLATWLKAPAVPVDWNQKSDPRRIVEAGKGRKLDTAVIRGDSSPLRSLYIAAQPRSWFELLDSNGDGQLSLRDLRSVWNSLSDSASRDAGWIALNDVDSQVISLTFASGKMPSRGLRLTRVFQAYDAPEWFRAWDRNGDGDLSRREFLGDDAKFQELDRNHDELIDIDEAKREVRK